MKPMIPVGTEYFSDIRDGYYFVDKTNFISEFFSDKQKVTLITRPRRFGKSLLMSMMQTFLDIEGAETNRKLFDGLRVTEDARTMSEQGKRPVIFLTLRNWEEDTWEDMKVVITWEIASLFSRYEKVLKSDMDSAQAEIFDRIVKGKAPFPLLGRSFKLLCEILETHYGAKPVLLIDEYDAPIQCAWLHGYYKESIGFFRNLFSSALKSNPALDFSILTGVLRIAKESIFSGLNNLRVSTVVSGGYADACGYTREDVAKMASDFGYEDKMEELARWYDGYDFQGVEIYNPWSVNNYFLEKCKPRPYWVNTSGNGILQTMLNEIDETREAELKQLVSGGSIVVHVNEAFIYHDIEEHRDHLYSLLLYTGYLKRIKTVSEDALEGVYEVAIPNLEIRGLFKSEILKHLSFKVGPSVLDIMFESMIKGNAGCFQNGLQKILRSMVSIHDAAHPESFYHGLMLGLSVWLDKRFRIESNRESGYGRFDIALFPKMKELPGVIWEFKSVKDEEKMEAVADEACGQIADKAYEASLRAEGVKSIWGYGIAFCGKKVLVKMKEPDTVH